MLPSFNRPARTKLEVSLALTGLIQAT